MVVILINLADVHPSHRCAVLGNEAGKKRLLPIGIMECVSTDESSIE